MKLNPVKNINFQKRYVATAQIGSKGNNNSVDIFQLTNIKDEHELKEKLSKKHWKNSYYSELFLYCFKRYLDEEQFYVIEDKNGDIVSLAGTKPVKNDTVVVTLETAPDFAFGSSKNRKYKYAGETILACIVELAKRQNRDNVKLTYRNDAEDFYIDHCGFKHVPPFEAVLTNDNYNNFLKRNQKHTNYSLEVFA